MQGKTNFGLLGALYLNNDTLLIQKLDGLYLLLFSFKDHT